MPSPDCYWREAGVSCEEHSRLMFSHMRRTLEQHHESVCAVIVEPLVQCAGGMRMYDPVYLRLLRQACDEFGVHLIADEIAVGMGRTGTLYACEQADISPDFMTTSKGLTGGYLPLAAILTTDEIYQAFYDDYEKLNGFLHSHSYTGNPLACAAALAAFDILENDKILERNRHTSAYMAEKFAAFSDHAHVGEVRQRGMILALEMVQDKINKTPFPWQQRRGLKVYEHALQNGALLRPLGNVIYLMPPYVIEPEHIDQLFDVAWQGINLACQ